MMCRTLLVFLLLMVTALTRAADVPPEFANPELERRYNDLIEEIRCLVCQNQSLADSHAELAQDLRHEVYTMMVDGKGNKEIITYLVDRYGDFVLYRPPLKSTTLLLWTGPVIFLVIGMVVLFYLLRRQQSRPLKDDEHERASRLLADDEQDAEK